MNKTKLLLVLVSFLAFSVVQGQTCNCTSGSDISAMGYMNSSAAFASDQLIGSGDSLVIGASGNVDIYGALQVDGTLEMLNGAVLNVYGNITVNGTLALASGATINYYGSNWANGSSAAVTNDAVLSGTPGNAVNFITPQPVISSSWLAASNSVSLSPFSNNTQTQYVNGNSIAMDIVMHVQNTSNVQLTTTPAVLSGQLSFDVNNGYFITNNQPLVLTGTGSITGYNENRYVVTNNNSGELRKQGLANGASFFFPVGRGVSDYSPANMQVTSGGPVDYYMNVRNYSESDPDESMGMLSTYPNVGRTWMLYASQPSSNVTMTLIHNQSTEANGYNHSNGNLVQWFDADGLKAWVPNENGTETSGAYGTPPAYWGYPGSYSVPSAKGTGAYYSKANTQRVLAVTLDKLVATVSACSVNVSWSTVEEQSVSYYLIEQSSDGRNYLTVGKVNSNNNALGSRYSYTQQDVKAGTYYYRLKIADKNGSFHYSKTVTANSQCVMEVRKELTAYPNPVTGNELLMIDFLLPNGHDKVQVIITDMPGKPVSTIQMNNLNPGRNNHAAIPMRNLPAGTYFLRLANAGWVSKTIKIIKL